MNLYLSDMDGTLLDGNGVLPEKTRGQLKNMLAHGLLFTVASARTPLSAIPLLKGLELQVPAILMSGALIYDMKSHRILDTVSFDAQEMKILCQAEQETGCRGLLISEKGERLILNLAPKAQGPWEGYFPLPSRMKIPSLYPDIQAVGAEGLKQERLIYGLYMDQIPERLSRMADMLEQASCFCVDFYQDCYRPSCWCMELTGRRTSKKRGVQFLRNLYPGARLIGFGDGKNDLSLFEACDEAYAVSNACRELKERACGILENSRFDGVVNAIKERWEKDEAYSDGEPLPVKHGIQGGTI